MGRVLLALVSTLFLVVQVMAGTWTSNNFLYKPATGARGEEEKAKFDSGLNRVDSRLANEKWLNDSLYNGNLATAISAIGSAQTTLSLPAGNWSITADLTVPANLTLKFARGALLTIATGKTLTINGSLEAGPYQIFSCTGTGKVVFGPGTVSELWPEWWGAKGDGTTNDKAAIQACLECPVNSTQFMAIKFLPSTYKILTGLTINEGYCKIDFNGAKIDASGMTTGTAITVQAGLAMSFRERSSSMDNLFLLGPGTASPVVKGIYLNDLTNDISQLSLRNIKVYQFETGIDFGNHTFLITLYNCDVARCTVPVLVSGTINAGENLCWYGGQIYECLGGIKINGAGFSQLLLFGVAIDYTLKIAHITCGQLILNDCYIEGNHPNWIWANYPIVIDGATSKFVMNGGSIICPSSPSSLGVSHIINNSSGENVGAILDGVYLANTVTTSNELATGAGITTTRDLDYSNSNATWAQAFNYLHITQGNLLADGGFEGASILDAVITYDSAPITSRVTGTNLALTLDAGQHHTGAKSLKATKAGPAATNAQFMLLSPLDSKTGRYASRLWYAKPGAETGTMYVIAYYAQVLYFNQYGTPVFGTTLQAGAGLTKTFTAAAVAWTQFDDTITVVRPPSWATHAVVVVSLDSCNAGNYYFDDAYIGR